MSIYTIAQHNMKLEIPYNNKLLKMRKRKKTSKDLKRLQKNLERVLYFPHTSLSHNIYYVKLVSFLKRKFKYYE